MKLHPLNYLAMIIYPQACPTYLLESVLYYHLPIRVRNAREKISYRCICLLIDFFLRFGYGFDRAMCGVRNNGIAHSFACFLDDNLSKVISGPKHMV
jgi:hypothetical protein